MLPRDRRCLGLRRGVTLGSTSSALEREAQIRSVEGVGSVEQQPQRAVHRCHIQLEEVAGAELWFGGAIDAKCSSTSRRYGPARARLQPERTLSGEQRARSPCA